MTVEEAAEQYGLKHKPDLAYIGPGFVLEDAFTAGAAWQKEQDEAEIGKAMKIQAAAEAHLIARQAELTDAREELAAMRQQAREHERHLMVPPNDRNLDNILLKDVIPWLRALAGGDDGE